MLGKKKSSKFLSMLIVFAMMFTLVMPMTVFAAAPVIATVSTIANAAVNPSVTVTGTGFYAGIAAGDLTVGFGATGLTAFDVAYVSGTEVTVTFTGTAAAGDVTIQANTSAFDPVVESVSNTLTVNVPAAFAAATNIATANTEAILGLVGTTATSSAVDGVATVAIADGKIAITSVSAGAATITVTDAASHTATIAVTIAADGAITIGTITKYGADKNVSTNTANNVLLIGSYAFELNAPILTTGYNLNNFVTAAKTAYETSGTNHVYFKMTGKWYDIVTDATMSNEINLTTINGDGLFNYMNMQ